jgi:hypothetical protein
MAIRVRVGSTAALAVFACGGGDLVLPDTGAPVALTIESGDFQTGAAGALLADPLVVRATDAADRAVEGATIAFSATNNGELVPSSVTTGSDGRATVRWTLAEVVGTQRASAEVVDAAVELAVTFTASATAQQARPTTTRIVEHTPDPSSVGRPVLVRVAVTATSGTPDGPFTVTASTGEQCTGDAGSGTCELNFGSAGTRTLVARYAGNDGFSASQSEPVSHTVSPVANPTQTTIGTDPDPSRLGEEVTVFVAVRGDGNQEPRGTVRIYDQSPRCGDGELLGQVELNNKGEARFKTKQLELGFHIIRGCYAGSSEFSPSEDIANQTVVPN